MASTKKTEDLGGISSLKWIRPASRPQTASEVDVSFATYHIHIQWYVGTVVSVSYVNQYIARCT